MENLQRFNFREFDGSPLAGPRVRQFLPTGRSKEEAPPPPPPLIYKEEDVKAAEREAYKKGFLEGTEEGRKQADSEQAMNDRQLLATLEKIAQLSEALFADYAKMATGLRENAPKIALAIARKVAGAALEQNAQAAVEETAARCLETLASEPKIAIAANEKLGDALQKRLETLAARLPAAHSIVILRDPNMPLADCRIEWGDGSIERATEKLWKDVEKVVGNLSAVAKRDAETHLQALHDAPPPETPEQPKEKE